jgi:diguanylate cyclase (GGDEF)-like protein
MPEIDWDGQMRPYGAELSVMLAIGGLSALAIAGYAVYRFVIGDWAFGLVNTAIFTTIAATLLLARTDRWRHLALFTFGLVITASCIASALLIGHNGLLWAYLVFWVNTFLLSHPAAIVFNLTAITVLGSQARLFPSPLEQISWITVAVMISAFGLYYANQMRSQRRMLRRLATHDPLTGAGNRLLMQHHLERAVEALAGGGQASTLVVLDLDHFKQINDGHGHEAGDLALKLFVRSLKESMRQQDDLYRMGGEEFVMLLRDMDADNAARAIPGLHRRLSGHVAGPCGPIHFSAGAATLETGESWSRWLARADRALYEAKRSGRDTLVLAERQVGE